MTTNEIRPPCLYMLWPRQRRDVVEAKLAEEYTLRTYRRADEPAFLELIGIDGEPISEYEWRHYHDALLPSGLFVVQHVASSDLVATAGAIHNPNPGRYYFPFGGELGYLIVAPEHRQRGLGFAVCAAVVSRLIAAGYDNIRACVQKHRLLAIRIYLRLGLEPFLHSPGVEERWRQVYADLNLPFTPDVWPTRIDEEGRSW